jgi:MoxR-like ATPase
VKTSLGYPDEAGERELVDRRAERTDRTPEVQPSPGVDPASLRRAPEAVHVADEVRDYVVDLARATRRDSRVETGVSPRGTQRRFEAARALAVVRGREYVTPDHVAEIAPVVLAHRLVLTPDARVEDVAKDAVVADLLDDVPVPTVTYTATPAE